MEALTCSLYSTTLFKMMVAMICWYASEWALRGYSCQATFLKREAGVVEGGVYRDSGLHLTSL
jgi:hypothetical protein